MKSQFTAEEITFLESEKKNGITSTMDSSAAYVRNLDRSVKQQYEKIYQRLINEKFHMCYHCQNDVFTTVRDVHKLYKSSAKEIEPEVTAPAAPPAPKPEKVDDIRVETVEPKTAAKAPEKKTDHKRK